MEERKFLLVDCTALPAVFEKVVEAKGLLQSGQATSTAEAARKVGISRSVFYKYKDAVFAYHDAKDDALLTIQGVLWDRPGVLLSIISWLTTAGANILTINQNIPVEGKAVVSISARVEHIDRPLNVLLLELKQMEGVCSMESIVSSPV